MLSVVVAGAIAFSPNSAIARSSVSSRAAVSMEVKPVVIGIAADSGCGKSTFMRRVTGIFGGVPQPPAGGNPDSNTLISEMTTVICLDDYHSLDRNGRKEAKVTALAPESQNFDLMYSQVGAMHGVNSPPAAPPPPPPPPAILPPRSPPLSPHS